MSQIKCINGRGSLFSFLQAYKQRASAENIFYCVVLGFKAETYLLQLHLTKYVKSYSL